MKCAITCTPTGGRGWFTVEESSWLSKYVSQTAALTKKRGKGAGKAWEQFYTEVITKFLKQFPYRDPASNPGIKFTKEQASLVMTDIDRGQLRSRVRSVLSLRQRIEKPSARKSRVVSRRARSSRSVGESVPSPPESVDDDDGDNNGSTATGDEDDAGDEDEGDEDQGGEDEGDEGDGDEDEGGEDDDTDELRGDGAHHGSKGNKRTSGSRPKASKVPKTRAHDGRHLQSVLQDLGPRYETATTDVKSINRLLEILRGMTTGSWAEVDEPTLRE
ncbi:hypothetical protein FRC06_003132 [Ceratobasidium sp. 370]|nr:hypothetical protein FRC06_003132 [Ceratobasidium sp. 370]